MTIALVASNFFVGAVAQQPPVPAGEDVRIGPITMPDMTPGPIPRMPDGRPDLSGIWGMNFDLEAYYKTATLAETEPVGFFGGMPNYRPEAMQRVRELATKDDPVLSCLPWGILRQPGIPMPIQLVQTPDLLVVLYEYFHSYRVIPTDGRPHGPAASIPTFLGSSVARWEDDTLIVDVIGFNGETWIGEPGTFHTENMHVVERYQLINENTLLWQATVNDPEVLAEPWVFTMPLARAEPGTQLIESICTDISVKDLVGDEPD
jgi:hypothetical protein